MKNNPLPNPNSGAEAQMQPHQSDAKSPTRHKDTRRSRLNATRHGLSGKLPSPSRDARKDEDFTQRAMARLAPRNALEERYARKLLRDRLKDEDFLDVERTLFIREPPSPVLQEQRLYPFLEDPKALKTLQQLSRHLAHQTHVFHKDVQALLQARRENWGEWTDLPCSGPQGLSTAPPPKQDAPTPPREDSASVHPGTLEACLADRRLILPDEDPQPYEELARRLWATFAPANILEGFVACDCIQVEWRLERLPRLEAVFVERCEISVNTCQLGFALSFIADSQWNQCLESLRQYEAALRKRLEKRMTLWRALRKQGWVDAILPNTQPSTEPPVPSTSPRRTIVISPSPNTRIVRWLDRLRLFLQSSGRAILDGFQGALTKIRKSNQARLRH